MKKIYMLLIVCLFAEIGNSQSPGLGFSYQAVARDANGNLLKNSKVELRFSLLPGANVSQSTYSEVDTVMTDTFGVCIVEIGSKDPTNFEKVDFAAAEYWMSVEIKDNGNFVSIGKQKLLSVPYAKIAGNAQVMPAGMIMAFAGDTSQIPKGWILCNGAEVSRLAFSRLFSAIGTNWGRGNNSSTFNLPDLRGMFLRGVSMNSDVDPDTATRNSKYVGGNIGNNVGSYQNDEYENHNHNNYQGTRVSDYQWGNSPENYGYKTGNSASTNSGGSETRPKNAYVIYIIKI